MGRSSRSAAAGGGRSAGRARARGALLVALCSLLLAAAGCASGPEPLPLMADSLLLKPVDRGRLSSAYGPRYHPILKRRMMHRGIDWAAPRGTPVRAAGHGMVSAQGPFGSYGRYLRIEHGGEIATAYAHLERFAPGLRPGHLVRQGDLIGHVGSSGRATGPHLHYELLIAGRQVDPLALPPTVVAHAPAPSPRITPAGFGSELGIGGPDTAAGAGADDPGDPGGPDIRSLPLDAIDGRVAIRIEDLLSLPR